MECFGKCIVSGASLEIMRQYIQSQSGALSIPSRVGNSARFVNRSPEAVIEWSVLSVLTGISRQRQRGKCSENLPLSRSCEPVLDLGSLVRCCKSP